MPILNMVGGGKKGGNIGEPLNLAVTTLGLDATITWEDNEIGTIPPTTFQKSELVRKIGSAPTSPSDGDLVVTETVKDTYKVSGYVDSGLTYGETYYYRVFSYSDLGGISYCDAVNVTPSQGGWQPGADTIAYYQFNGNLNDSSGNSHDFSVSSGTVSYNTLTSGQKYMETAYKSYSSQIAMPFSNSVYTINMRVKYVSNGMYGTFIFDMVDAGLRFGFSDNGTKCQFGSGSEVSGTYNTWNNIVVTLSNNGNGIGYLNGTQVVTFSGITSSSTAQTRIIGAVNANFPGNYVGVIDFSELIIEGKTRTAQEISDYYNNTKANYGIS